MPARLTYTESHGNAEIVRLMLAACGEEWEDRVALDPDGAAHLTKFEQFDRMCAAGLMCFDQFPLLQIDGFNIVQKHAAVRYLARKHGLYGRDNAEATQIDIISDSLTDFDTFGGRGGAMKEEKARDKYLPRIERALRSNGGGTCLVGGARSFADVQLFYILDYVAEGAIDAEGSVGYLGKGLGPGFLSAYPLTAAHYKAMRTDPRIAKYLQHRQLPRNGPEGWLDTVKQVIPHAFKGEQYPMTSKVWHFRDAQDPAPSDAQNGGEKRKLDA